MRALSGSETDDLLRRNFSLSLRVTSHNALVATGRWSQVEIGNIGDVNLFQLPIPPAGFTLKDDKFGNVVIFPDAKGKLHYVSDVPDEVAAQVNKPPYSSPSGNSIEQAILDAAGIGNAAAANLLGSGVVQMAIVGAVVVGLYWVTLRVAFREL